MAAPETTPAPRTVADILREIAPNPTPEDNDAMVGIAMGIADIAMKRAKRAEAEVRKAKTIIVGLKATIDEMKKRPAPAAEEEPELQQTDDDGNPVEEE